MKQAGPIALAKKVNVVCVQFCVRLLRICLGITFPRQYRPTPVTGYAVRAGNGSSFIDRILGLAHPSSLFLRSNIPRQCSDSMPARRAFDVKVVHRMPRKALLSSNALAKAPGRNKPFCNDSRSP
jgi:hypothetical protein